MYIMPATAVIINATMQIKFIWYDTLSRRICLPKVGDTEGAVDGAKDNYNNCTIQYDNPYKLFKANYTATYYSDANKLEKKYTDTVET